MNVIESFSISRLLTGQHLDFHLTIADLIEGADPVKLGVEEIYPKYVECLNQLKKHLADTPNKMPHTAEIEMEDKNRSFWIRYIMSALKRMAECPERTFINDFGALLAEFKEYDGTYGYEMSKKTQWIDSFLEKVEETSRMNFVQIVGEEPLRQLKIQQKFFKDAWETRTYLLSEEVKIDAPAMRRQVNEYYETMREQISLESLLRPSKEIEHFINIANATISVYRKITKRLRRGGTGNEEIQKKEELDDGIWEADSVEN